MNDLTFEKVNNKHYKIISEIYNYYISNSTATYHVKPLKLKEVITHFQIKDKHSLSFVIKRNSAICGFCCLRPYSKKEGYKFTCEISIYIKNDFVKKGIGSSALKFLEKIAKENNIHVIIAGICAENKGSIKLFRKNGYKECGHFKEVGFKFNRFLDNVYFEKIII
jgi:phosphinothricin acetyltransferase